MVVILRHIGLPRHTARSACPDRIAASSGHSVGRSVARPVHPWVATDSRGRCARQDRRPIRTGLGSFQLSRPILAPGVPVISIRASTFHIPETRPVKARTCWNSRRTSIDRRNHRSRAARHAGIVRFTQPDRFQDRCTACRSAPARARRAPSRRQRLVQTGRWLACGTRSRSVQRGERNTPTGRRQPHAGGGRLRLRQQLLQGAFGCQSGHGTWRLLASGKTRVPPLGISANQLRNRIRGRLRR